MESCSNQKSVKQIKIYFRFFNVATRCLDDRFAHSWHSLNQLREVVTWNAFQLTGVPCLKFIYGISFLNTFEPISCVVTR
jgi:glutathione peroxidase-family protein